MSPNSALLTALILLNFGFRKTYPVIRYVGVVAPAFPFSSGFLSCDFFPTKLPIFVFNICAMIETLRLRIQPLTLQQVDLYKLCNGSLEASLGIALSQQPVHPELEEALTHDIIPVLQSDPRNVAFSTLWLAVSKESNMIVAELCFMGPPTGLGEVVLGYGTYPSQQGKGFMTEAVGGMVAWAFSNEKVKTILAQTEHGNVASWRVLQKNGFTKTVSEYGLYTWSLTRPL